MKTNKYLLAVLYVVIFTTVTNAQQSQQYSLLDHDMPLSSYLALPVVNPSTLPNILPPSKSFNNVELYAPEVGDQGSMGACTTWSLCYCAGGILAYDKFGDMDEAKRSPAFLFNQYKIFTETPNDCSSTACYIETIISKMQTEGVCSYDMMPYIQDDCTTQPTSSQKFDAYLNRYTIGRLASANNDTLFRTALSNGYPVVVELKVCYAFDYMWNYGNGIWTTNDTTIGFRGYHACCVVGYDNSTNRFKVQNSWGTDGGSQGYFYVSYNLVKQGCFTRAYIVNNITPNEYPYISGPNILCDSAEYYIINSDNGLSYQWTYDIYSQWLVHKPLFITSHGDYALVKRGVMLDLTSHINPIRNTNALPMATIPYVGTRTLLVTATHNGAQYTMSREINMLDSLAPHFNCPSIGINRIPLTLTEDSCTNIDGQYLTWTIKKGTNIVATGDGHSITYRPMSVGTYYITVTNSYSCPTTSYTTSIFIKSSHTPLNSTDSENYDDYYVYIYDSFGNLVMKYKSSEDVSDYQQLSKGLYVMKVLQDGNMIYENKIIVK